ncbi:antitoxin VbhA family protein [Flintibacter porci]|uniref:antitoxin VbhA family protein n=1 Tax=Flintibacter porci TaxID=3342383 RepID=UPI003F88C54A
MRGGEGALSSLLQKRIAAVKTADAISAIEGTPISDYARDLSASWARGELTGGEMKDALLAYHRMLVDQECRSHA